MTAFNSSASAMKLVVTVTRSRRVEKARNGRKVSLPYDDAYLSVDVVGPTGESFHLRHVRAWADVKPADFEEYLTEDLGEANSAMAEAGVDATPKDQALKAFEALARTCHAEARKGKD